MFQLLSNFMVVAFTADLRPDNVVSAKLATMGVLPLLLAGVLGSPCKHEHLSKYLKFLLFQNIGEEIQPAKSELVNSVRFLWLVFVRICSYYYLHLFFIIFVQCEFY